MISLFRLIERACSLVSGFDLERRYPLRQPLLSFRGMQKGAIVSLTELNVDESMALFFSSDAERSCARVLDTIRLN